MKTFLSITVLFLFSAAAGIVAVDFLQLLGISSSQQNLPKQPLDKNLLLFVNVIKAAEDAGYNFNRNFSRASWMRLKLLKVTDIACTRCFNVSFLFYLY